MFKSIEYKLYLYIVLLIVTVVASTYFAIQSEYVYMTISIILALISLYRLHRNYNQFNKNILFLLNALENGDFTFNFRETKLSRRERELNQMLNRIKEILAKARTEVIENEKFLSVIMESVSTGIIILDDYNMVMQVNSAVNRLLGLPVFTHIKQLGNIDKSLPDMFRNLKDGDSNTIKIVNEREEVQLSVRVSDIIVKGKRLKIITLSNIGSELDYMEIDSWIKLIRVLTHEIMNSIAPLTSLTDTLLTTYSNENSYNGVQSQETDLSGNDDLLRENTIEALQTINTTAKGLINFVNSYRKFTAIPKPQMKPVSMQSLIEQGIKLNTIDFEEKQISISLHTPTEPVFQQLDESQIMQVLQNLLKNAAEAVSGDEKQIKIELSEERDKIHLDVCNNGQPIPQEVLSNIFVPFFTTKETGTGIGLSISRYIMRLHGGSLTHIANKDRTVFRLTFQKQ